MKIENMPGCCTSAILYSFGEHGEPSEVTLATIKEFVDSKRVDRFGIENGRRVLTDPGKRNIIAFSVDPKNIAVLKEYGFKEVDSYPGIQGDIKLLTLHD